MLLINLQETMLMWTTAVREPVTASQPGSAAACRSGCFHGFLPSLRVVALGLEAPVYLSTCREGSPSPWEEREKSQQPQL